MTDSVVKSNQMTYIRVGKNGLFEGAEFEYLLCSVAITINIEKKTIHYSIKLLTEQMRR